MSYYSDIVFANDLCCAYVAAVIRSFSKFHRRRYLGRTATQKLVYFVKVLGAPVPASFEMYTYGPYSDKITFAVESLLVDDVIIDRSKNPGYSNYRPGPNAERLLEEYGDALREHVKKIDHVVAVLGKFEPKQLELIATLHYVSDQMRPSAVESEKKTAVIEHFLDIKGARFSESEVTSWYDALEKANLLSSSKKRVSRGDFPR